MKTCLRPVWPFFMPAVVLTVTIFLGTGGTAWFNPALYGRELKAISIILPYLTYVLIGAGMLLAWRFHQTGMGLSAWLLGLSYAACQQGGLAQPPRTILLCLLSLEIALFSIWRWRRLPSRTTGFWLVAIALQTAACVGFPHIKQISGGFPTAWISSPLLERIPAFSFQAQLTLPPYAQPVPLVFFATGLYLLIGGLRRQDVLMAGLLGALVSVFLSGAPGPGILSLPVGFAAAGLILLLAGMEASFFMAYRDELTGLPSRRALNQTLSGLGRCYTIAMIDVDHFKKFNDTYGHKTGDQVLRLLASQLARMTGGAKAFRYGGEEFTAVFPGKSTADALPHLDTSRQRLSETPFTVRGKARKKANASQRGKSGAKPGKQVRITISIGAAEASESLTTPSQVLLAADKALYRAKKAGRNCVKT